MKTSNPQAHRIKRILDRCRDRPDLFHSQVLGRPPFHPKQKAIARSLVANPVVVVPGAHSVGKSWMAASLVLWWLYTRRPAKVVTTSPSATQLVNVMWSAIKEAHANSRIALGGSISEGNGIPQRLDLGPEHYALGFTTTTAEKFSGYKGALIITDESSDIPEEIWTGIEGCDASRLLVLGNPVRSQCKFRSYYQDALNGVPGYVAHQLTAFDSPYAELTKEQVAELKLPGNLCSKSWIEDKRIRYGESSPWWNMRVMANFPDDDFYSFIPKEWIDRAFANPAPPRKGPVYMGVDPAGGGGGGDASAIVVRDTDQVLEIWSSNTHGLLPNATPLAPEIARLASKWKVPGSHIIYDATGNIERTLTAQLATMGFPGAVPLNVSIGGGKLYKNHRVACYAALKRRIDPDHPNQAPFHIPRGPHWESLREELMGLRTREDTSVSETPKQSLEEKKHLKSRIGRSPDLADALSYSCFMPTW